jgi:DNA processing protein
VSEPRACPDCLRRARLLADLAPYIERVATGSPGSRSPELLRLSNEDLVAAVAPRAESRILEAVEAVSERSLESALAGGWCCCRHDPLYPAGLRDAADAPWALFGRGDPALLGELAEPSGLVTVVGARRASAYGREVARQLSRDLAAAGLVVVSGLAFGIDACAHRGALETGRTVAVLGCGVDVAYPAAHRSLWRRVQENGLVLSELPPGTGAWRWTFPARNRVMAALAAMTVVVEAAERSGSLITADLAADLGRDLGAVPGPVNSRVSAGPNSLLAGGACLVRDAQDVLDAMLGPGVGLVGRFGPPIDPAAVEALAAVELGEDTCDAVAAVLDISGAKAATALAGLESKGYVTCSLLGTYTRTMLRPPASASSVARVQSTPRSLRP